MSNGAYNETPGLTAKAWILYTLVSLVTVLVILALLAIGVAVTLPQDYSFARTIVISQPPEVVWWVIRDIAAERSWRSNLRSIDRLPDRNGHETWRLRDNEGQSVVMEVLESVPPHHLMCVYEGRPGIGVITWIVEIRPVAKDSRVTLLQRSTFYQHTYRFLARFVYGTSFADDFLKSLARKFGDPPVVQ